MKKVLARKSVPLQKVLARKNSLKRGRLREQVLSMMRADERLLKGKNSMPKKQFHALVKRLINSRERLFNKRLEELETEAFNRNVRRNRAHEGELMARLEAENLSLN
ncbi:MAG: hypothetical protein ABID38_00945 [Candidatus Diapherotrites archaeon]